MTMVPAAIPYPLDMPNIEVEEYNVIINVLGLRNLLSTGLLPIKKAYVKFSVKSLLPSAQAKAVNDIFTTPDEGGTDPNIRTTIKFSVNISSDPWYCPRMTCTTYDKLYFEGMAQPILGTFTLRLGDILKETRKKDADTIAQLEKFNDLLKRTVEQKKQTPDKTVLQILRSILAVEDKSKQEKLERLRA